jgi:hypothetical protein
MPCRDWENVLPQDEKNAEQMNEISFLTQLACDCCHALEQGSVKGIPESAKDWWKKHKAQDAIHRVNEKKKQARQQAEAEAAEFLKKRLKELGVE